jgi:hypothetical protein
MNKSKLLSTLVFMGLIGAIFFVNKNNSDSSSFIGIENDQELINRTPQNIIYTQHAKCRMNCRFFSKKEVLEILKHGKINTRKSKPNDKPCPSYALEGRTSDGQLARMVFANCGQNEIKVITCIDLETDYSCDCY